MCLESRVCRLLCVTWLVHTWDSTLMSTRRVWLVNMWDTTFMSVHICVSTRMCVDSCGWRDLFTCGTPFLCRLDLYDSSIRGTRLLCVYTYVSRLICVSTLVFDVTRSRVGLHSYVDSTRMTRQYVGHDFHVCTHICLNSYVCWLVRVTWLVHTWDSTLMSTRLVWLVHTWNTTPICVYAYVCRVFYVSQLVCVTWLVHTWDSTLMSTWRVWLVNTWDTTLMCVHICVVWHDSHVCPLLRVTWLVHMWDSLLMSTRLVWLVHMCLYSSVCPLLRLTWLFHMWDSLIMSTRLVWLVHTWDSIPICLSSYGSFHYKCYTSSTENATSPTLMSTRLVWLVHTWDSTPWCVYTWQFSLNATLPPLTMLHSRLLCRLDSYDSFIRGTRLRSVYMYMAVSTINIWFELSRHKSRGCSFWVEGVTPSTKKLHPRLLCRLTSDDSFIRGTQLRSVYMYMKVSIKNATLIPLKMLHPRLVCRINWYDMFIRGTRLLFVYTYMTVSTTKLHPLHWKCYTLDSDVDSTRMTRSYVVLDFNLSIYNLNLFIYMCLKTRIGDCYSVDCYSLVWWIMTCLHVWRDFFMRHDPLVCEVTATLSTATLWSDGSWLLYMCDVTFSCMRHDPHVCDVTATL